MRVVIFGAGAVGAYVGGRLAQAGAQVALLARGDHLQALARHGLRVDSPHGDFVIQPWLATADPTQIGVAARIRFAAHVAPHLVELRAEPTTHLERIRTPYLHLHVLGGQVLQHRLIHLVEFRFFFF